MVVGMPAIWAGGPVDGASAQSVGGGVFQDESSTPWRSLGTEMDQFECKETYQAVGNMGPKLRKKGLYWKYLSI